MSDDGAAKQRLIEIEDILEGKPFTVDEQKDDPQGRFYVYVRDCAGTIVARCVEPAEAELVVAALNAFELPE